MAFIAGTPIFTDSGYKNVEDISGRDKVLVRNFLGYAEFIQPFALKKKQYSGEIVKIGGASWSLSTTPNHTIAYDRDKQSRGINFKYCPIKDIELVVYNKIHRGFKYIPSTRYEEEHITITDELKNKRWVQFENEDWFIFAAYVLLRGKFKHLENGRLSLSITLDRDKQDQELIVLGRILNKIGVEWRVEVSVAGIPVVKVSDNNTIASRISHRLGSATHGEMHLTNKMIYNSTKELMDLFLDTIISLSRKKDTEVKSIYQIMTNNKKFLDSLVYACTLWGYSTNPILFAKKGTDLGRGQIKKDVYLTTIRNIAKVYVPQYKLTSNYNGPVYEIDIFEGQVYTKEGTYPIWVNPK